MPSIDYRSRLISHFESIQKKRPGYSLRAYARDLGVNASQISRVISRKQNLSLSTARKIAEKIFIVPLEAEQWLNLVEEQCAPSPKLRALAAKRNKEREITDQVHLDSDRFHVLADWYHLAILEALSLTPCPSSARKLSKLLGITPKEAELGLERLQRLDLIKCDPEDPNSLRPTHRHLDIPSSPTKSRAIQHYHFQTLALAQTALQEQTLDQRYFVGHTMALPPELAAKAKGYIQELEHKLHLLSEEAQKNRMPLTQLVQIQVQQFVLNRADDRKSNL